MPDAGHLSRDIIVVGGSSGAFTVLTSLLAALPDQLPAAVFIVLHSGEDGQQRSPELLAQHSTLPLKVAEDGAPICPGTVTLAPAGKHLLLGREHVHLRRGPRENNFRPAIDPLFRSAAVFHSSRTIGVVLSGLLDDGAAGSLAVHRMGGTVLVQDPADAVFADMPSACLELVPEARAVQTETLADVMAEFAGSPAGPLRPPAEDILIEMKIAALEGASMAAEDKLGTLSPYNCPDCNGVLWEIEDGRLTRYRCHTGHAFTLRALNESQERAMERSLYDALRAHRGRISLLRKMAEEARDDSRRQWLLQRAVSLAEDAEALENLLLHVQPDPERIDA